jgi:peptidoglycan/xylan/chitin deacetylase (PgdA/CDA1 family)
VWRASKRLVVDYGLYVAPPGRPTDPPDRRRPGNAGNPEPEDWDWGDDDAWDGPSTPPRAASRPAAPHARNEPRHDGAAHEDDGYDAHDDRDSDDDEPRPAGAGGRGNGDGRRPVAHGARPAPSASRAAAIVRRRRLLAGGGTLVVLLLVILVVSSVASGGEDDRAASVPLLAGPLEAAAAQSADHLERVAAVRRFAEMGEPIYCGGGKKPWVAFTYDDGPSALSPAWIKLLSDEKIPVTSFRVGSAVPGKERYIEVQRNLGWDNGTHTQSHPQLTTLSEADQRREIEAGNDASERVLGRKPEFFRPPYQAHNRTTDQIVKNLGQVQILWNVDTEDSLGPTTADKVAQNAIEGLRPGSIILMHETKENTLKAMPKIIQAMRERNLEPVTVSKMLAGDPPSEQQVKNGYAGCLTQEASGPGEGGSAAS